MTEAVNNSQANGDYTDKEVILEIDNLKKWFPINQQAILFSKTVAFVKAVNGVSFKIYKGETLGLVGESGCGKSTTAKLIVNLEQPTEGTIKYRDIDIANADHEEMRIYRNNVQMIFQDPYSSLNPRMTVFDIIKEPYEIMNQFGSKHNHPELVRSEEEIKERVLKLLNVVGLETYHALRYPHEFSGGQRQRIGIARSLAVSPEIIIADEPVSALDVSIQAQILNLLREIQRKYNISMIFVAHDLSVVKHVSDRIAVMYLGRICEIADKNTLFKKPLHPYSISLLSAIPRIKVEERKDRIILEGDVPSPINPPSGCVFRTRCYKAQPECSEKIPEPVEIEPGHIVACFYPETDKYPVK